VKITIDIDCTPEEARAFLGLPDLGPMQRQLVGEMQERMSANLRALDPQEMMKLWLAPNLKGFEQIVEAMTRMGQPKG
jgi:Family of unknown function (DUF6489)